ncbi:MAG: hypothetical protein COB36_12315 [Alphaproteobacteria bacterium]|nr:MAG: hypothetical protein COB36_12315 [Alphaproteobacteria bacterium]
MWKLWHKLFGWDFIQLKYGWGTKIRRVRYMPSAYPYVVVCGSIIPIKPNGVIEDYPYEYTPLTWRVEVTRQRGNLTVVGKE